MRNSGKAVRSKGDSLKLAAAALFAVTVLGDGYVSTDVVGLTAARFRPTPGGLPHCIPNGFQSSPLAGSVMAVDLRQGLRLCLCDGVAWVPLGPEHHTCPVGSANNG